MKRVLFSLSLVLLSAQLVAQSKTRPMNVCVIQPAYQKGEQAAYDTHKWMIDELDKCSESCDLIVLPESSGTQALLPNFETTKRVAQKNTQEILDACSKTAKRCQAVVFINALDKTEAGYRNTTFAFNQEGKLVGKYLKQQLTMGERRKYDTSYSDVWSEPYILEIDGIRYAFLTCYDFYYYENFSNIARMKPDIIIGCSHQRSDPHYILEFIDSFCAYNTAAYLVRSSVSMGLDSKVGGCSMVVSPDGHILGNMRSGVGSLCVTIDPFKKYLKPAGFGNPLSTHPEYAEIGRRPWKYRPAGSAIVPGYEELPSQTICAMGYFERSEKKLGLLPSLASCVAMGAREIGIELSFKDGKPVATDGQTELESILRKLSCHAVMNLFLSEDVSWTDEELAILWNMVHAFDACRHTCFVSASQDVLKRVKKLSPNVYTMLMGNLSDDAQLLIKAKEMGCNGVILNSGENLTKTLDGIKTSGMRCYVVPTGKYSNENCFSQGANSVVVWNYSKYLRFCK
ncbi:MAG: hypothetical protein KBS95_01475 [Alistipes sp.]|nr:hypothetical protein [Candidatus Alistipes equi]